ncbi:MAG TPA: four-helix bundle copper-binding protein [Longimicrobiaceae bacterium]|nr:four-helix bundle copper-binding protein [Longimicrobiaceae bacterium]
MHHAPKMLETHPRPSSLDRAALADCVHACFDCEQTCTSCADACLGEPMLAELVRCIRLNLDCADVCGATGRLVARQTETEAAVLRAQLQACAEACRACGEECEKHAEMHDHCRVCAEACRECERACRRLLDAA